MKKLLSSFALLAATCASAATVKIEKTGDGFRLLRDGQPYFIKGAGGDGSKQLLKDLGGNSFRTWGADGSEKKLDEAQKLGLTMTLGIWLGHKQHGFDYRNAAAVAGQLETARKAIDKYKNHPALLMWGIGNEMEIGQPDGDPAVWQAVEQIAAYAKKVDPNHPTMVVIAEIGGDKVAQINKHCPSIDVIGINSYGGGPSIPERYKKAGGIKPYIITEFGPPGTWEVGKNAWNASPELTSTEKAARYRETYEKAINQPMSLGSYAFTWGNKQEATATWFGLLLPDGSRLGAVDALSELWTGKPVPNRVPAIKTLKIQGAEKVGPESTVRLTLDAADPENDPLKVDWLLQGDPVQNNTGGATEAVPPVYPDAIVKGDARGVELKMPKFGGAYRVFVFLRDNHGGAAVANVPLFVEGGEKPPASAARRAQLPFAVYDEADTANDHFVPAGYMGNAGAIKQSADCEENPHSGKTCLKVEYTAKDNWGGVVWQSPANDWGDAPGGWDLTGAKKLTFWARGAKGGESVSFSFGLLGKDKKYPDTAANQLKDVRLTDEWSQFTMYLKGQDLSRIKTGFCWIIGAKGETITFYLDDVRFE